MDKSIDGFWSWIEGRSKVQFYVVFAFMWLALHWQTWVTLFFVSGSDIATKYHGMLKVEYIKEYCNLFISHGFRGSADYKYWLNFAICFLVSSIVAYVCVWYLPKWVLLPAYDKEREHELAKRTIDERKEEQYLEAKKATAKAEESVAVVQESIATKRQSTKAKDETVLWDEEYEDFQGDPAFDSFAEILKAIYENKGRTKVTQYNDGSGQVYSRIPASTLALADGLGLIKLDNKTEMMELTSKGRHFAGKYPLAGR